MEKAMEILKNRTLEELVNDLKQQRTIMILVYTK